MTLTYWVAGLNSLANRHINIILTLFLAGLLSTPNINDIQKEKVAVIDKIATQAKKHGLTEEQTLEAIKIVRCESNFEREAKNPNSTASSYAQFLKSTWRETMRRMLLPQDTSVFDENTHINAFLWLYKTDGNRHWNESRACWSKGNHLLADVS